MPSCRSTLRRSRSCASTSCRARSARTVRSSVFRVLGLSTIRRVSGELRRDVRAVRERDPAARDVRTAEIVAGWPGLHALLVHRVAHALHGAEVPAVPRVLAYLSRSLTG